MKQSYCRLIKCPRLMVVDGEMRCNQQGTDSAVYSERLEFVGPERCMELREELRKMRRGTKPWRNLP